MLTHARRALHGSIVVVSLFAGSATASAATDKKETTKKTWAVDASHGSYGDTIPIEVPAFRGITPQLAISYDSSDGNGPLGVGWSLDGIGVIERASPGKGAPHYDDTDVFLLDGQELVACASDSVSPSCTSGGTHSTKVESYERIAFDGGRWTITAKDGIRRVYAPVDAYRWGLEQAIDTKDNVVTYAWGEYPESVTYNGVTITFHYETRSDLELAAIGSDALRTMSARMKTIDVSVDGGRVRAYQLSYTKSSATLRSLLSSVQQFGTDAKLDGSGTITGGTSLPAITIDYQAADLAFAQGSHDLSMHNDQSAHFFAIDIDGDGKSDMVELYPSLGTTRRRTWISTGDDFIETSDELGMSGDSKARFMPMDVDGDGRTDIVELYPNLVYWGVRTWISNGTGFVEGSTNAAVRTYDAEARFLAMDVDGDGRSDLVELYRSWGSYRRVTWISDGEGFTDVSDDAGILYDEDSRFFAMDVDGDHKTDMVEIFPNFGSWGRRIWSSHGTGFSSSATDSMEHSSDDQFIPMDINGDGKEDLLQIHPFASVNYLEVWLSTGHSFTLASNDVGAPFSADNWYVAIDVNGDGKSDLVELDPYGLGLYRRQIWLSVGDGFVAGAYDIDMGFDSDTELLAADVDGDGLSEMIELYPAAIVKGRRVWSMNAGEYPDLLASITNSHGGTTAVEYTPSSAWENTNNPPLVQTATAVTTTDGRGGSATTHYEYGGGLHDRVERRFLGFRYRIETLPCVAGESICPRTETWFRQDYGAASKAERIDHLAGTGELLRSELYEYTTNGATLPWTSLPTGKWEYTYVDGGAACPGAECKRTYIDRTFDEYAELAVVVDYGDYDVEGDENTLTTTFVPNTKAYIVNRPAEAKTFAGVDTDGTLLNQTLTYYDGASSWDRAPSAGFATTTARWLSSPSSFVETHKDYDAWGNVIAEIDALGARTESTFDSSYHLLPTSTTNALGQPTSTVWDVVCGGPTETTDLNGQATTVSYDALCRVVEKIEPNGRFERHRWMNLGDAEDQHEVVETPGQWTRSYFDGYRRQWRTVAQGPDAKTGDIHVDTSYDARGQAESVTAPYYRVAGGALPPTYATTSSYDALDRLIRVTHPDGAYTTKQHRLWSVTDTDELGRARTDHFNADDQRVAHEESIDGEIETTTYVYDARGHLAESTDPRGNTIEYETDSLGRQTSLHDPDSGAWTYEYDGADRLTAQTDAKGQRTELAYDALGRKIGKTSLAGTDAAITVSWTHDEVREGYANVGKLTTITDEAGSETFDHDVAGNVVKSVRTIDDASYSFEHGFDQGNRKLWTIYPDGDTLGTPDAPLTYDGAGRVASIPGYVDGVKYDAGGKLTRIDHANGTVTTRQHSPERGWLTAISTTSGDATIQELAYTRDAKGMIAAVDSAFDDESWTYEYDELDRLTAATNATSSEYDQRLEYDAIGNVTWNSRFGEYTYDASRPHAVTAAGSKEYEYDAAGLMISGAGRTLGWDGDNRVASIDGISENAERRDDEDGTAGGCGVVRERRPPTWPWLLLLPLAWLRRRRGRASPASALAVLALAVACAGGSGHGSDDGESSGTDAAPHGDADDEDGTTMTFGYDANGARIVQVVGTTVRHHLGDGYEVEVGGATTKYISIAGSVVARTEGDTKAWLHTDHLGSIQAATDDAGVEVHRKNYHPYGEILATEGTLAFESRGFTGQRHDASGLVYLHARYYDPALSRFISPDTIISGSDTIGLNRYAYAANDPIDKTDVDGHSPKNPDSVDGDGAKRLIRLRNGATMAVRKAYVVGRIGWAIASATIAPPPVIPPAPPAAVAQATVPPAESVDVKVPRPPGTPKLSPDKLPTGPVAEGGPPPPPGTPETPPASPVEAPKPGFMARLGELWSRVPSPIRTGTRVLGHVVGKASGPVGVLSVIAEIEEHDPMRGQHDYHGFDPTLGQTSLFNPDDYMQMPQLPP